MVPRTDRLLQQVRVSFEATRFGPPAPDRAYARLVPVVRRTSPRPKRSNAQPPKMKVATVTARGGDR